MNRDEILRLAREAGVMPIDHFYVTDVFLQRFVHLVEQRLIREGYRKCAEGQRTTQFCGLLDAAVKAERERCCQIVFGMAGSDNVAQRTVEKIQEQTT